VENNTPYVVNPINVTMIVTPPASFGKITGTVTVTDCKGNTVPLKGVQIQADGKGVSFSLTTDASGNYAFWASAGNNPFNIIASKDGYIAQVTMQNVVGGNNIVTVNFDLQKLGC
jgi:hypothetical protein